MIPLPLRIQVACTGGSTKKPEDPHWANPPVMKWKSGRDLIGPRACRVRLPDHRPTCRDHW
jgi:hypothetical protein